MTKSLPSGADKRIIIGKLGAPHGVRGYLRVIPMTDFPDRFRDMTEVFVGESLMEISSVRYQKNHALMAFKGIESREAAAKFVGSLLSVDRKDAVPLDEGEYYTFDIIGMSVFDEAGGLIGEVNDVIQTGSNDAYAVSKKGGGEILIPALKSVVLEISLEENRMIVKLPEGL